MSTPIAGGAAPPERRAGWRHFDWPLLVVMLLLIGIGIVMIYSSYEVSIPQEGRRIWENAVYRQALFAGVGLVLYFALTLIDYRIFVRASRWLYGFVLVTLGIIAVLWVACRSAPELAGHPDLWHPALRVGQGPDDPGVGAAVGRQSDLEGAETDSTGYLHRSADSSPPVILIYLQPDFGTALILTAMWVVHGLCERGSLSAICWCWLWWAAQRWRRMVWVPDGRLYARADHHLCLSCRAMIPV